MSEFDQAKYKREYNKAAYHRIVVYVPKDKVDAIRAIAKESGVGMARLLVSAVEEKYGINLSNS